MLFIFLNLKIQWRKIKNYLGKVKTGVSYNYQKLVDIYLFLNISM